MIYKISNKINIKYSRDFMQEFDSYEYTNNYNRIDNKMNYNKNFNNNDVINNFINNNSSELGHYLAGLIEADGSVITPKKSSKNTPAITISFHEDDKPLAEKICDKLGYGSIELIPSKKAVKIHIRGKYSILNTLFLINGKFRTPKIEKLNNLINYACKNWNNNLRRPLILLPLDDSPLDSNSWLSGFSDGDANFYININWPNEKKYGQIKLTFEIIQSRLDKIHFEKYKFIMNKIALFCKSKLEKYSISKFDRKGKQNAWRARVINKVGITVIVNYFNKFPLFSSKHLNYLSWKDAYLILIVHKEHIGRNKMKTYEKIKLIKEKMNKKRKVFNWNHLDDFYI
jgi:hypothetical protein